jgi:Holliday junction resolvase RusA-like endonuclease
MYLTVQGIPKAQPRVKARAFKVGNVCRVSIYTPDGAKEWKDAIAQAASLLLADLKVTSPLYGKGDCLGVTVIFIMPRPKSHYGSRKGEPYLKHKSPMTPIGKPDLDNLIKAGFDALNGLLWHDDCQIVEVHGTKRYVEDGESPGMDLSCSEGL